MDWPPAAYLHTPESFQTTCLTGNKHHNNNNSNNNDTKETVTYTPETSPKRPFI
jgi:hypothetical protein